MVTERESQKYLETHTVPLGECWYNEEERTLMMEGMINERGVDHHKIIFYGAEPRADRTWNVDGCEMYVVCSIREVLDRIVMENRRDLRMYVSALMDKFRTRSRLREAALWASAGLIAGGVLWGLLELLDNMQ